MKMSLSSWWRRLLLLTVAALSPLYTSHVFSEDFDPDTEQAYLAETAVEPSVAEAAPALEETPPELSQPPAIPSAQASELRAMLEGTHLPGPVAGGNRAAASFPSEEAQEETQSTEALQDEAPEPLLSAEDAWSWNCVFQAVVPESYRSNVMENSVGTLGKYVFQTGNWFAARSTNGGVSFSYVDPFSGFVAPSSFCCDQRVLADESRNILIWLRQGSAYTNPQTGNYENEFKLSISNNGGASFLTYSFKPTNTNGAWTDQWWDYPDMQIAGQYLYITYNMFDKGDSWTRSTVLRFPLDSLRAGAGFSYSYYWSSSWSTFKPVAGADHTMYWASNWPSTAPQNNRIAIWKWDDVTNDISSVVRNVSAWSFTGRGDALCGGAAGNWTGRLDQRITAGARYSIHGDNIQKPGRKILAWWWTVKQGGDFPYPYIEGAAFYEDNLTQVSGQQGRPLVWNNSQCFAYPDAASNVRSDVALVINYSATAAYLPYVGFAIADAYVAAPPGWVFYGVRGSDARPNDNKWGDYNTVRRIAPAGEFWSGASHILANGSTAPVYFVFGREGDKWGFLNWYNK